MIIKEHGPIVRLAVPVTAVILAASTLTIGGTAAAQALPPRDGEANSLVAEQVQPGSASPASAHAGLSPASVPAQPTSINLETFNEGGVTKSGARRMSTKATYFPAEGRVVAQTRTWNSVKMSGFTGGVVILFENAQGQAIGYTTMHKFGVNGTWLGGYSRTDFWEESVTAPWAAQATRIVAVHSHASKGRLVAIVEEGIRAAKPVVGIVMDVQNARPAK